MARSDNAAAVAVPTDGQQARFFVQLQHLLAEGEFVSTYKYALLIALTRWAVENPDYDESLPLDVAQLAPGFLAVYWPQARPFAVVEQGLAVAEARPVYRGRRTRPAPSSMVLGQDRGGQRPRVLRLILDEQSRGCRLPRDLPQDRHDRLLREVAGTIRDMPLWKLHMTGAVQPIRFLYRRGPGASQLLFEPGIVRWLANFSLLIEQTVRAAWLRFVLRCNAGLLGTPAAQLEEFLFPGGRGGLELWRPVLHAVQGADCFYCGCAMHGGHVDHFLPWSRYPRDLGHNFVLAHAECNQRKRDHLASAEHLARWCRRNDERHDVMAEAFDSAGLPHDWPTLRRVATTLYEVAADCGAAVWRQGRELVPLDSAWRRALVPA